MKVKILSVILIISALKGFSQDCTDYHQYHCQYGDYTFFYSRQSKSMLFTKGQTSEIQIIAYGGEDYFVSVCTHRKFGNLHFRILDEDANRTVLYDNADNEYEETITFTNESTKNLVIEVSVPEGSPRETKEYRCVGVVVQFRKTGESQ